MPLPIRPPRVLNTFSENLLISWQATGVAVITSSLACPGDSVTSEGFAESAMRTQVHFGKPWAAFASRTNTFVSIK